nr:HAD-IA family hydrolase [Rhodoferax sp.]
RESLARLHMAGLRKGVVTGARMFAIASTLRSHTLAPEFEVVISADEVVHSKPAPECYLLALERMGLEAHEVVALEDTEHGVASAIAAGLACVAIPTAMSAVQDFSAATVVLPDMAAAVDWVLTQG